MTKFIFITGGVVSGLGKGIVSASLGRILKARGIKVAAQKLDPYINVDPGTMSPYQHGEVFVTEDGAETDLDLGHYERFIDEDLNSLSNLTTGKVFWNVLRKERAGEYLGKTVQIIPHVTDEIKSFIYGAAKKSEPDVLLVEVGGTVGDIESQPFIEAIRQIGLEVGEGNAIFVHVTLVPYLECSKEHKSKPTQHSVKELQGMGIKPNIIVLRTSHRLEKDIFSKIALFCNIEKECVIENRTIPVLYEVPLRLEKQHLGDIVCKKLGLKGKPGGLKDWETMVESIKNPSRTLKVAIVGKYVKFTVKGKTYKVKTNKNGVATLKIALKPGKYTVNVAYGSAKVNSKITVKTTLITKNLSKKVKKSAKFKVKVLTSKGKAYANKVVKVKFKGKTYKIKTNGKGIATFKVPKNLKVGKYTIKTTCNGLTNTNKIIVKK